MKTDLYTKIMLTVIALALSALVLENVNIFPKLNAATTDFTPNVKYGLVPLNPDGSIDVNIKSLSEQIDVRITDINTADKLKVIVDEVKAYAFLDCTVPVKVKH